MKKAMTCILVAVMVLMMTAGAYALPKPKTAHYPRGGLLTLSSVSCTNNTYAFKATGRNDGKVHLQFANAYADQCDTSVSVQIFVVNKWGNWIAFGNPKTITLACTPEDYELYFPIRAGKEFCVTISAYGITGNATLPYTVSTY